MGVGPGDEVAMETDDSEPKPEAAGTKRYYIDSTVIGQPREGVEMKSPLKDGLSKWSAFNFVIRFFFYFSQRLGIVSEID